MLLQPWRLYSSDRISKQSINGGYIWIYGFERIQAWYQHSPGQTPSQHARTHARAHAHTNFLYSVFISQRWTTLLQSHYQTNLKDCASIILILFTIFTKTNSDQYLYFLCPYCVYRLAIKSIFIFAYACICVCACAHALTHACTYTQNCYLFVTKPFWSWLPQVVLKQQYKLYFKKFNSFSFKMNCQTLQAQ